MCSSVGRLVPVLTQLWLARTGAALAQAAPAPPGSPRDTLLPVAALRADLRLVRTALEESQVGLDWYLPRAEFTRAVDALDASLVAPMPARVFYRRLLPVVAALQHGHLTLERPVDGVGYRMRLLERTRPVLPLAVVVLDGRVVVTADLSAERSIGEGAELVAIEGRPVRSLVAALRRALSTDAFNTTWSDDQLGRSWRLHELLDLDLGGPARYRVRVRPSGSRTVVERVVAARTPAALAATFAERTGAPLDTFPPAVALTRVDTTTMRLAVSSFYQGFLPRGVPSFDSAFADAFRRVREAGATTLLVDVRGNEGGDGAAVRALYAWLASRPFATLGRSVTAGTTASWLPHADGLSDTQRAYFADPAAFVARSADSLWVLRPEFDETGGRPVPPQPGAFRGRVIVLVDGGVFSATNDFLAYVARERATGGRAATIVGVPKRGGDAAGRASGGQQATLVLPATRLRLTIALLGTVARPGEPVAPLPLVDRPVVPTAADIVGRRDAILEVARRRAAGGTSARTARRGAATGAR